MAEPYHNIKFWKKSGAGGMGIVYKALDTRLDRKVALKFLSLHDDAGKNSDTRFLIEAKAAAALNHPNIVTIYEIGEYEGRTFIAMEFIHGQSLRMLLKEKPWPLESTIDIAKQICSGLQEAHGKGVVHRDIKPENIIIDAAGRVKILDFGLAKVAGRSRLTQEASLIGTLHIYVSGKLPGQ